jgi:hypothetical protein
MKRHNVKARRRRQFQEPYDAATHPIGGLLGEGYSEDACRVDAVPDEMDKAARQGLVLPEPVPARVS